MKKIKKKHKFSTEKYQIMIDFIYDKPFLFVGIVGLVFILISYLTRGASSVRKSVEIPCSEIPKHVGNYVCVEGKLVPLGGKYMQTKNSSLETVRCTIKVVRKQGKRSDPQAGLIFIFKLNICVFIFFMERLGGRSRNCGHKED